MCKICIESKALHDIMFSVAARYMIVTGGRSTLIDISRQWQR